MKAGDYPFVGAFRAGYDSTSKFKVIILKSTPKPGRPQPIDASRVVGNTGRADPDFNSNRYIDLAVACLTATKKRSTKRKASAAAKQQSAAATVDALSTAERVKALPRAKSKHSAATATTSTYDGDDDDDEDDEDAAAEPKPKRTRKSPGPNRKLAVAIPSEVKALKRELKAANQTIGKLQAQNEALQSALDSATAPAAAAAVAAPTKRASSRAPSIPKVLIRTAKQQSKGATTSYAAPPGFKLVPVRNTTTAAAAGGGFAAVQHTTPLTTVLPNPFGAGFAPGIVPTDYSPSSPFADELEPPAPHAMQPVGRCPHCYAGHPFMPVILQSRKVYCSSCGQCLCA